MNLRELFAANLRRLRHAKGVSQDELAYEADMSRSYLSQLEKGEFYSSLKIIGKLACEIAPKSQHRKFIVVYRPNLLRLDPYGISRLRLRISQLQTLSKRKLIAKICFKADFWRGSK